MIEFEFDKTGDPLIAARGALLVILDWAVINNITLPENVKGEINHALRLAHPIKFEPQAAPLLAALKDISSRLDILEIMAESTSVKGAAAAIDEVAKAAIAEWEAGAS